MPKKLKRKSGSSHKSYTKILMAAGVVISALYFTSRSSSREQARLSASVQDKEVRVSEAGMEIIHGPDTSATDGNRQVDRANAAKLIRSGLRQVPLKVVGDRLELVVRPTAMPLPCKTGDLDLLKILPDKRGDKIFLGSLESFAKKGTVVGKPLGVPNIEKSEALTFSFPNRDDNYGLYFCVDRDKSGTCAEKPIMPQSIWKLADEDMKKAAQNTVFYFQLILVRSGSAMLIPSSNWTPASRNEFLKDVGGPINLSKELLGKADSYISKLKPIPATFTGRDIEVPFPFNVGC